MLRPASEDNSELRSLKEGLQKKERELDILYQVDRSLSSGYLEHLLNLIVNLTTELIHCEICSIMLLDTKQEELVVRATQSLDDEYLKKKPISLHNSLSGIAILERRSVQWYDILAEDRFSYHAMAKRLGLRSLLTIPMFVNIKPIGVINYYTKVPYRFITSEIRFLEAIANQTAVAIERNYLSEQVHVWQRTLKERKLIERAKGILMEKKRLTEREAFEKIRRASMDARKSMREIADAIILADAL